MFAINKNSYLQLKLEDVNPRIINRSVDLALRLNYDRNFQNFDAFDIEPPFNRLCSQQPCIPVEKLDLTRRPVALGRWAMPKLRRELHDKNPEVVHQAVASISDIVHDPERAYEAIHLNFVKRMADLTNNPDPSIREYILMSLICMAELQQGKMAIVNNHEVLENLTLLLIDPELGVKLKAATLLQLLAKSWIAADEMNKYGFIPILLNLLSIEESEIIAIHLETIQYLMYCEEGKETALNLNAFQIFVSLLENEYYQVLIGAMDCIMTLAIMKRGKKLAIKMDILPILYKILQNNDRVEVCSSAASALMMCTIKTSAKHIAAEIEGLSKRLIDLARNHLNQSLQINCFGALTNICEHPKIRKEVSENYFEDVMQIQTNKVLLPYKNRLMQIVDWKPWSNY